MYTTKSENFLNLQSLMKHDFCLKHVLRHFKVKICLKYLDDTGPCFVVYILVSFKSCNNLAEEERSGCLTSIVKYQLSELINDTNQCFIVALSYIHFTR